MDGTALRELLRAGALVSDGGMGTSLVEAGAPVDACFESWCLDRPEAVLAVHRGFVGAGARLVLTNTFGANRFRLGRYGLAGRLPQICEAAVVLARRSGAEFIGGSIGPLGVRLAPYGRVRPVDAEAAYREQIEALAAAGVDLLVVETQLDVREIERAVAAARDVAPGLALAVTATFTRDDRTPLGSTPAEVARALAGLEVDAIGANCGEGPAQILRVIEAMRPEAGGRPLIARPNAGGPAEVGGRIVYPATPDYVAEVMRSLLVEGVAVVGGCCGTRPTHTRAIAAAVADAPSVRARAARVEVAAPSSTPGSPATVSGSPIAAPVSELAAALARERFVVAVEMEPPRSTNAAALVAAAETLRDAGATVIDVADSPMARMRMSAWAACRLIQERAGIETVLHFPTRGRNLLRLQGDLLGAHALGIRNLFVCLGDPVTIGDHPRALNDVDVTATGLLALVTQGLNAGVDRSGASIGEPTAFFPGAAVAPSAGDLEREARVLRRKVEAGARFLLSQPLFDPAPLRALRETYWRVAGRDLDVPILAGVLPLASGRHARFLDNEVPGVSIPEPVLARLERAGEGERAWAVGRAVALEAVEALRADGVAGIYLVPHFGRYDRAAELVEAIAPLAAVG